MEARLLRKTQPASPQRAPSPKLTPAEADAAAAARWLSMVRRGSYKAVSDGIRQGWAPINSADEAGFTALMRCCVSGQMLELVLDGKGCDVNHTAAPDGSTPLLLAARHRSVRTVHTLLSRGARLTRDTKGASVLHKAAANPNPAVAQLLLEASADPCARDSEGRCPLGAALLNGNEPVALLLMRWQQARAARPALHAMSFPYAAARGTVRHQGGGKASAGGGGGGGEGGGGCLLFFGGFNGSTFCNDTWHAADGGKELVKLGSTGEQPQKRFAHACAVLGSTLFVFGGSAKAGEVADLCVADASAVLGASAVAIS